MQQKPKSLEPRSLKSESGIHSWLKPSLLRPSASTSRKKYEPHGRQESGSRRTCRWIRVAKSQRMHLRQPEQPRWHLHPPAEHTLNPSVNIMLGEDRRIDLMHDNM